MGFPQAPTLAGPLAAGTLRKWPGLVLLIAFAAVVMLWVWKTGAAPGQSKVMQAFVAGLIAAGATALGTLPVLITRRMISARVRDVLLGFGAGVMLAATSFSLVIPALASAATLGAGRWSAGLIVACGMLLGAGILLVLDNVVPQTSFARKARDSAVDALAIRRAWLFVFAVSLHNLPEGLAIGVGYAGSSHAAATTLATGITIQDFPEGLVISLALLTAGYQRTFSILVGALSGAIEPVGAALGAAIIGLSATLLPWGLALAGGAMLYVISHDIIPESHGKGNGRIATVGLMLGFVLMTVLDTALQ